MRNRYIGAAAILLQWLTPLAHAQQPFTILPPSKENVHPSKETSTGHTGHAEETRPWECPLIPAREIESNADSHGLVSSHQLDRAYDKLLEGNEPIFDDPEGATRRMLDVLGMGKEAAFLARGYLRRKVRFVATPEQETVLNRALSEIRAADEDVLRDFRRMTKAMESFLDLPEIPTRIHEETVRIFVHQAREDIVFGSPISIKPTIPTLDHPFDCALQAKRMAWQFLAHDHTLSWDEEPRRAVEKVCTPDVLRLEAQLNAKARLLSNQQREHEVAAKLAGMIQQGLEEASQFFSDWDKIGEDYRVDEEREVIELAKYEARLGLAKFKAQPLHKKLADLYETLRTEKVNNTALDADSGVLSRSLVSYLRAFEEIHRQLKLVRKFTPMGQIRFAPTPAPHLPQQGLQSLVLGISAPHSGTYAGPTLVYAPNAPSFAFVAPDFVSDVFQNAQHREQTYQDAQQQFSSGYPKEIEHQEKARKDDEVEFREYTDSAKQLASDARVKLEVSQRQNQEHPAQDLASPPPPDPTDFREDNYQFQCKVPSLREDLEKNYRNTKNARPWHRPGKEARRIALAAFREADGAAARGDQESAGLYSRLGKAMQAVTQGTHSTLSWLGRAPIDAFTGHGRNGEVLTPYQRGIATVVTGIEVSGAWMAGRAAISRLMTLLRGAAEAGETTTTADGIARAAGEIGIHEKELARVLNDAHHIFSPTQVVKHRLTGLLESFSNDSLRAFKAIEDAVQPIVRGRNLLEGEVYTLEVKVNGLALIVRGRVINGIARIGTAFLK